MIHPFEHQHPRIANSVMLAPDAVVIGDVEIGRGSSVWFQSVLRGDVFPIRIGESTNLQDHCIVHVTTGKHATHVGNEVTVGHRVILHGCTVRDRVLVGMGAIVMDGAEIGEETMIGAGSLVTPGTKIPPKMLALGSPAKVVRPLREEEIRFLKQSAQNYVELAKRYPQWLK